MSQSVTLLFLAALLATTFLRLWLATRQLRHVRLHRERVPAAFRDTIPLAAHQRAADYTVARARLTRVDAVVGALFVLALTLGGGLQWLHDLLRAWPGPHAPQLLGGLLLVSAVVLVSGLVDLPLSLYRTFVIEERFGFNRMTLPLYLADLAKGLLIGALIGLPLLALVLWLMDAMGRFWWFYVWLVWLGFNLLALFLYPTLIAPRFNTFSPLADVALKARIEALLERCGFRAEGLFVMDGSKRSAHGNAYFTGFGRAKRIVFFDTLLDRLSHDEVEAVLAHELGHFKHHHVWQRIALLALTSLFLLWLLGLLIGAPGFYQGLGVREPGTAVALVLFALVLPLFLFPLAPLTSLLSRRHEDEADRYAARQTRADDLISALVKLYRDNAATLTPDPLHSRFHDSHPPAAQRIAQLMAARPS